MGDVREILVFQDQKELKFINDNHWSFHIAKSVDKSDGSAAACNTIWQSKGTAPNISIQWNAVYALNWTTDVPQMGKSVSLGGNWQRCDKGQAFDLDATGCWVTSATVGVPDFMCINKVDYEYPDVEGIHFIVGVENSAGHYDKIFVDETALLRGCTARYQPVEGVYWWYEVGLKTGQMHYVDKSSSEFKDLTKPSPSMHKYFYATSYKIPEGRWKTQETRPEGQVTAALASELVPTLSPNASIGKAPITVDGGPAVRKILFGVPVGNPRSQAIIKGRMEKSFSIKYKDVQVRWASFSELWMTLTGWKDSPPTNSVQAIGPPKDDIDAEIKNVLEKSADVLPSHEKWVIEDVQGPY